MEGKLEPRTTDAEGFFSVEVPLSDEEVSLAIWKPLYLQTQDEPAIQTVLADRAEVEIQVELIPAPTLEASNRVLLIKGLSLRARMMDRWTHRRLGSTCPTHLEAAFRG